MTAHPPTMTAAAEPLFGFDITFSDLYRREGLVHLDSLFLSALQEADAALHERLLAARADPDGHGARAESDLLMAVAPHLQDFLGALFGVGPQITALAASYHDLAPLYACKRLFVQRKALKAIKEDEARALDGPAVAAALESHLGGPVTELGLARAVMAWLDDETAHAAALEAAARYCAHAVHTAGPDEREHSVLFRIPGRTDPQRLVPTGQRRVDGLDCLTLADDHSLRRREGFDLTDAGAPRAGALDEANYCIFCHHQGKDSCSHGMKDKKTGDWARSPVGRKVTGCPLEERISEFQETMSHGDVVAALGLITIDNPMCAGTGHRICNDCMVGCIYNNQNRTTVNIPQAETRVVRDVLALPWGFEIYGLLTRWNPLNLRRPLPQPDSGRRVLVVGLGPAGYTLSHYLLNDGHTVVAVDGLKIEPLESDLSGVTALGERVPFRPIRDVADLWEPLSARRMAGFGGVAEYGITVRWDKTFLKVIRLLLERRDRFALFGGVRMGGTLTPDSAFGLGFDHVALCSGAGKPTIVPMENGLARGVRQASDFLMALQLTGAGRRDSITNLQIRLPVVVIGGGLTAIDATTEALAYYPLQVEKFLVRYEALVAEKGEALVRASFGEEEAATADEFLAHARLIRAERAAAAAEGRPAKIWELLDGWGGATLVYRRRLTESPAYRNNPEEVVKALEEGIRIAEQVTPVKVALDRFGHAEGLVVRTGAGDAVTVPARAIIVAAGTVPNVTLAAEVDGLALDGKYFQAIDEAGHPVRPEALNKPAAVQVLSTLDGSGRAVSFFGDQHPSFAGNVVAAMASAKQGWPVVSRVLARRTDAPAGSTDGTGETAAAFVARLNALLRPTVHAVTRLTPTIVEVTVRAPLAARMFRPGQFYRLQNFETNALRVGAGATATTLAMEGLALTGAWVDEDKGLLSMIALEMGGSSDLISLLRPGEPVVVMGPTGAPTETPAGETVLLVGGGLGNAVLFSIGRAFRSHGSRVLYFAGYKAGIDRYKVDEIKAAADVVVWCCDEAPGFAPERPQDKAFVGNIVAALEGYATGRLGEAPIALSECDRIVAIGSDGMMNAIRAARHGVLEPYLKKGHEALGSINSPMQCMMKEICAQCLQVHRDPETGREMVIFSCMNQDQPLDRVDFANLRQRLSQQGTQEKLTRQWIDHCLVRSGHRARRRF